MSKVDIKLFYFHVPKTGGSSINKLISDCLKPNATHIEGMGSITDDSLKGFRFVSGHVSYSDIIKIITLAGWRTMTTLREPYSFAAAHLAWVRRLAEPENKVLLSQHPAIFQKIASEMLNYDFAIPYDLDKFIDWLDLINFSYFHDTQTLYFDTNKNLDTALINLNLIKYIGVSSRLDDFMDFIFRNVIGEFSLQKVRENVHSERFGLDINNGETRYVIDRLISKDKIIYEAGYQRFIELIK